MGIVFTNEMLIFSIDSPSIYAAFTAKVAAAWARRKRVEMGAADHS